MRRLVAINIFMLLGIAINSTAVQACATCLCGDPTITTMGTEKPFAGRMRVGVEYLAREEISGTPGLSEHKITEERITYNFSYAISERWIIAASVPMVDKQVERFDLSEEKSSGMGDTDIAVRWFAGGDKTIPARNLWGLQFGLRVPTSEEEKANGTPIDFDAQAGAGAAIPSIGAWYGRYQMPWFFYASATVQHALDEGYQGYQAGDVLLVTGHSQYALGYQLALQFSLDGRWKEKDQYNGNTDDDSGGFLLMASPGIAWTPVTDLVLNLSYQIPAIEDLNGKQKDKAVLRTGITYDF